MARKTASDLQRQPWHPLRDERPEQYEAFRQYCRLAPSERDPVELARLLSRAPEAELFRRWHREYLWDTRSVEWDAHLADLEAAELERAAKKRGERDALRLRGASLKIEAGLARLRQIAHDPTRLSPMAAAQFLREGLEEMADAAGDGVDERARRAALDAKLAKLAPGLLRKLLAVLDEAGLSKEDLSV